MAEITEDKNWIWKAFIQAVPFLFCQVIVFLPASPNSMGLMGCCFYHASMASHLHQLDAVMVKNKHAKALEMHHSMFVLFLKLLWCITQESNT